MEYDPADFQAFQQLYESVTKLPEDVTTHREFSTAMRKHAPQLHQGRREWVLLSISVSATGDVERVRAIQHLHCLPAYEPWLSAKKRRVTSPHTPIPQLRLIPALYLRPRR